MPRAAATLYAFGRFRLDLARRELTAEGAIVALSSRAFDLLALLIEHRDRVVTKDEIMAAVWRGSIVEDNNLAVQISALRRALEQRPGQPAMIVTVPGRGYRFVAAVETHEAARAEIPAERLPQAAAAPALAPAATPPPTQAASPQRRVLPWRRAGAAALLLLACTLLYAPIKNRFRPPEPPRLSIVVMPFRNLTGDAAKDYLADAVSDDLTTDLSHIPGSLVIARETADAYKGRAVPVSVIGRALNVRYLMEGSLSQGESGMHINAQLIDTATSGHLWADMFDVARDRIGDAQYAIVRHIASAMNYTLVDVESARSRRERPDNPDAVDLFLQARSVLDRDTSVSGLQAARQLLQRSVDLDAHFGEALAELGRTILRIITIDDPNEVEDFALARMLITRAVAVSPRSQRVILASGSLLSGEENCAAASSQFIVAVRMEPNDISARAALGECALRLGQPTGMLEQLEAIQRIDPQTAGLGKRLEKLGMCHLFLGQPGKAIPFLDQALAQVRQVSGKRAPDLGWEEYANLFDIAAKVQTGNLAAARAIYRKYKVLWPNRSVWRMGVYFSKALQNLPVFTAYEQGLRDAGMPYFASEMPTSDVGVGDFKSTPRSIDGARVIETSDLELVQKNVSATIFDIGHGAVTLPSAVWIGDEGLFRNPRDMVVEKRTIGRAIDYASPVVVMADGPYGSASYDFSRELLSMGFRHVLWYRGGEESWKASNLPYIDRRIQ